MSDQRKGVDRRSFLAGAGAGVGALLVGASRGFAAEDGEASLSGAAIPPGAKVGTRKFGRTGVEVSTLSLGGMFNIPNNQLMLKKALDWGVTYWDTADCYEGGNSELGIGQYFEKMPDARKQVFLVTKSDKRDPAGMSELLARSLDRLKTDHIDLYFIHGVRKMDELNEETKKWAEKAKAEKKIRFFGFSTHSNMQTLLLEAATLGWIDGIMMTYNYRLMHEDGMKRAVDACEKAGIGLCAMKTQGGGPVKNDSEAELKLAGRFLEKGFTSHQAKLKAVWENGQISAICSLMPNVTILKENVVAALDKSKLTAGDLDALKSHARETASAYCAGCREICEGAAGCAGAPLADVMRYMMYGVSYGNMGLAREMFAGIPGDARRALQNADLAAAERACPRGIMIGEVVREAFQRLA